MKQMDKDCLRCWLDLSELTYVNKNNHMLISSDCKISALVNIRGSLGHAFGAMWNDYDFLKPNTIAFDIGAYIGDSTDYLLSRGCTVYAFEPDPVHFSCLDYNCPNAINFNCGIASGQPISRHGYDDRRKTNSSRWNGNDDAEKVPQGIHYNPASLRWKYDDSKSAVKTMRLDDFIEAVPSCSFLKIDIQGFEVEALAGGVKFIKRFRPNIFIEMEKNIDQIRLKLNGLGYVEEWEGKQDSLFIYKSL